VRADAGLTLTVNSGMRFVNNGDTLEALAADLVRGLGNDHGHASRIGLDAQREQVLCVAGNGAPAGAGW
jgi:hypothetical protein